MKIGSRTGDRRGVGRSDHDIRLHRGEGGGDSATASSSKSAAKPSGALQPKGGGMSPPEKVGRHAIGVVGHILGADNPVQSPHQTTSDSVTKNEVSPGVLRGEPDRFLTEKEAGRILNVSIRTLQAWRYGSQRQGPTYHVFGKCIRYRLHAVLTWAMNREIRRG